MQKKIGRTYVEIHSGYGEIGGNMIEVSHGDTSIILDLGISFKKYKNYYEWPSRLPEDLAELMELGVVPIVDNLIPENNETYDAALVTHAHRDHIELLFYLEKPIPIYMGETSKIIQDTRMLVYRNSKYRIDLEPNISTFRTDWNYQIGDISVEAIHVDHSIPGAYSYIVSTPDATILYTGDYRLHGGRVCEKSLTMDMVDKAKEHGIDLLLTEGTRFTECSTDREVDVLRSLNTIMSQFNGTILFEYSYLDIDRYESLMEAAGNWDKTIIFESRHFAFIYKLYKEDKGLKDKIDLNRYKHMIKVYHKPRKGLKKDFKKLMSDIESEGYTVISDLNEVENFNNVILEGFDLYIRDIYKLRLNKCLAIHSTSEPYDEDIELSYEKISNWLKKMNAPSYRIHTSGHIHPLDLIKIYNEIRPDDVLVVHSEYPEEIRNILIRKGGR